MQDYHDAFADSHKELLDALKSIQYGFNFRRCPSCGGWKRDTETDHYHAVTCPIASAIKNAEEFYL